jgi:hypothetical protein
MTVDRIDDALDSMTRHEIEGLIAVAQHRLQSCVICHGEGAQPVRFGTHVRGKSSPFALWVCPACIVRYRVPAARAPRMPSDAG